MRQAQTKGELMSKRRMTAADLHEAALDLGLVIGTYCPGDGVARYRFFQAAEGERLADYDQGNGIYTALGCKEAGTWLEGYRDAKQHFTNERESR